MSATRHLYIARHAEPDTQGSALTPNGQNQAHALGRRLATLAPHALHCGPSPRARATAQALRQHLPGLCEQTWQEAGDLVPTLPKRAQLPPEHAQGILDFTATAPGVHDPDLTRACLQRFTGPAPGPHQQREVLITHAFTAGLLLAHALHAPLWRWVSLAPAHASLTVIRYPPHAPASPTLYNDQSHLEEHLRWTGLPHHLRP